MRIILAIALVFSLSGCKQFWEWWLDADETTVILQAPSSDV